MVGVVKTSDDRPPKPNQELRHRLQSLEGHASRK